MRLVDLVARETGVDAAQIMLLRHSTDSIDKMEAAGVTVREYTSLQPPGTKYDYWAANKPRINIVVVIVRDRVDSVYRVLGVEAEGNLYSLGNNAYERFNISRGREDRPHRRFRLDLVNCTAINATITGWEGKEISAVLRSTGSLFWEIQVNRMDAAVRLLDDIGAEDEPDECTAYFRQDGDRRPIVERQIRERRGQQQFRESVRKRYGDCCLITGCATLTVLEAAHINPYRGESDNHPENGLLLRSDVHTLFDLDLLGIDADLLRVVLHPDLAKNKDYESLSGKTLDCPPGKRPSDVALKLRFEQFRERIHGSE